MPFTKHLSADEITTIHATAIQLRLASSRTALLAGIDPGYVDELATDPSPSKQLSSDLEAMNRVERLDNGDVPLRLWLSTAVRLTSSRREAVVFKSALDHMAQPRPDPDEVPPAPGGLRWPEKLTGAEISELSAALRSALPTRDDLARMLATRLDRNLEDLTRPGTLENVAFELVKTASAQGWVPQLFDGAIAQVPRSPDLLAIADKRRITP
jgi:hypothetical protein